MPGLNSKMCQVGDIILFYAHNIVSAGQGMAKGMKVLTALPGLVSAARGGSAAFQGAATCGHAAIITRIDGQIFNMAHAGNAGVITEDIDAYLLGRGGSCAVYRLGSADYPRLAGQVGATWTATEGLGRPGMVYSTPKGSVCAFGSSSFDSGARRRAAFYRANANTLGGPQDIGNMLEGRSKAMFCSMFVIACYQAVMPEMYAEQMLALDAKHTTPMFLDGYLKASQHWTQINAQRP